MSIDNYIRSLNTRYQTGIAREHTYRGDLQELIESFGSGILATNEPARIACGAPDFIITQKGIPLGYIEAKDIGSDLLSKSYKDQFNRYLNSLGNLIITDYVTFRLYREGSFVASVSIGDLTHHKIKVRKDSFASFGELIQEFLTYKGQTVHSAIKLSKLMAGKARLLANIIETSLVSHENNSKQGNYSENSLHDQFVSFKNVLIHDIDEKSFADIYAQTIAYGMFAARLHDPSLDTFSRQEAAQLIPKSNPFLRRLFQYIAGYDLDDRIVWIVDALADLFRSTNVSELLQDFGKATQQMDPIIHFYETFLSAYDPKLRKSRGVWYTPEPVVKFIVRAVDEILKTEFNLPQGLADNSRTKIEVNIQGKKVEKEVHKVQILDPAAGTGTFLAEIIRHIYSQFEGQLGIWDNYVENHLIPRLNGFEILMASYAMAHLKLDLLLRETGFESKSGQRFRVFLTNSLEEYHPDTGTLFASWLSAEANEANHIKRDTPVMCVIGNPPYSGESSNSGNWIYGLIDIYKKDHNNQKIPDTKWLNNDYVKFLRYGQHFIENNGSGILAFITDNSYLDSISFRGMRWNLLKTYDTIHILNLHGNSTKKDISPDGNIDENVFDIKQGVSINIFVKTGKKKTNELSKIYYYDLFGKRDGKYDFLTINNFSKTNFIELPIQTPNYFFVPKDFSSQKEYDTYFKIDELLKLNGVGICSKRDDTAIQFTKKELIKVIDDFRSLPETDLKKLYKTEITESRDKKTIYAKENIIKFSVEDKYLQKINYRPFDIRSTYFTNQSRGFLAYPVYAIMQHLTKTNYGLIVSKNSRQLSLGYMFITCSIVDLHILDSAADSTYVFPLYLYPETIGQQSIGQTAKRSPNLNTEIVKQIADKLGLIFTTEKETNKDTFAPIDILDYVYAALHSPVYRQKYKVFLKDAFPRIPYPPDNETFWKLVALGGELRQIHLLESPVVNQWITTYPNTGSNIVEKINFETSEHSQIGRVWINKEQYFDGVPLIAWNFYIGGYQPAQKWLKDRKGRELAFEDIVHYQKIIIALVETNRLMGLIDQIDFL